VVSQVICLSIGNYSHTEDAARLRKAIARLSRSLRATDSGTGLTPTQLSLLATVATRGELPLSELCRIESLNPTLLSRSVGNLEQAGLLVRQQHPHDRRAALVDVTPAGLRLYRRIRAERTDVLAAQLRDLGDDDRAALLAALPALERIAERLREPAPVGATR
jgi:DNA-binding MarR family transcriptional regulator